MQGVALKVSFSIEECFGAIVRTYTISRSAAVVPRSNCERRRRCSSRYCWLTRGANSPRYDVISQWCLPCRVRCGTDQCALHSRYSDAFLMDCLAQGNDPQCQQEDRFQYGRSLINVNIYTISPPPSMEKHTLGRNEGCSSITELLRNFCMRQSFPWMANLRFQYIMSKLGETALQVLTCV